MIKLIVAIKKLPELSSEEFSKHWRETHAALVRDNPASKKYIKKYIQCHTIPSNEEEVAFDGTAEIWFDSVADQQAFFSDEDYLTHIQPDEGKFADMTRTVFFITKEEMVI